MKKTYQQPIMLTVHLKPSHVVCASAKGNAGIKYTDADDEGVVIRTRQHSVWDNEEDE